MKKSCIVALFPGLLIFVVAFFVLSLLLVKLLWAWTIPDLFPGAVTSGLVAKSIGWLTSLKLAIFLTVLGGVSGLGSARKHGE